MPLIQFFLYSEVSVLLCALALSWSSLSLLSPSAPPSLVILIGSATFLFYTLERNLTLPPPGQSIFPEKSRWLKEHRGLNFFLMALSGALTLGLATKLSPTGLGSFLLLAGFALCYSIIKLPQPKQDLRPPQGLKRLPWAKSGLMVLIWTYMTLLLPALEAGSAVQLDRAWVLAALWGSWVFSNTLLFDIRDLGVDQASGCTTFAAKLGRTRAHQWIDRNIWFQALLLLGYLWAYQELVPVLAMALTSVSFLGCNRYLQKTKQAGLPFYIAADLTLVLPAFALALYASVS